MVDVLINAGHRQCCTIRFVTIASLLRLALHFVLDQSEHCIAHKRVHNQFDLCRVLLVSCGQEFVLITSYAKKRLQISQSVPESCTLLAQLPVLSLK